LSLEISGFAAVLSPSNVVWKLDGEGKGIENLSEPAVRGIELLDDYGGLVTEG